MDWSMILTLIGANVALFGSCIGLIVWMRSESRADFRMMLALLQEMKDEMKDFHGRLCAIEERRK